MKQITTLICMIAIATAYFGGANGTFGAYSLYIKNGAQITALLLMTWTLLPKLLPSREDQLPIGSIEQQLQDKSLSWLDVPDWVTVAATLTSVLLIVVAALLGNYGSKLLTDCAPYETPFWIYVVLLSCALGFSSSYSKQCRR